MLPINEDTYNSIVGYIVENAMLPAPGEMVTINPRFRGIYKAFKHIYGEVISVDKVTKTAKVEWEIRRVLPDTIPIEHLEIEDDEMDEDEEEDEKGK